MSKEVLVIGSGSREHALGWALKRTSGVELFTAPGNAGTGQIGKNLPISAEDIEGLIKDSEKNRYTLIVVGPEAPLAKGIVNEFQDRHLPIIGPTQEEAILETSKVWARHFMARHGIPQPSKFATFGDYRQARDFLENWLESSVVIKADGLCGGKGVFVCETKEKAQEALKKIMVEHELGPAGDQVVIEEKLFGREASVLAFTDGKAIIPLLPAEDYKQVFDGDQGPNTGGMGGVCPHWEVVNPEMLQRITREILIPTIQGMAVEGRPYKGILYAGLMITEKGPKVLEFNARFGDPETQVILPLLESPSLLRILMAVTKENLDQISIKWKNRFCVGVVLASEGYPGIPRIGRKVTGLEGAAKDRNILIFEGGTEFNRGKRVSSSGRILTVVGLGKTPEEAAERAHSRLATPEDMKRWLFPLVSGKKDDTIWVLGGHYRTDIAQRGTPRY